MGIWIRSMSYSKYQEALDRVKEVYIYLCDEFNLKKAAVKMNDDIEVLQELVDKATPRNPSLNKTYEDTKTIYDEYGRINELLCVCPNCGESAIYDFEYNKRFKCCSHCGQRIDWSDENDR